MSEDIKNLPQILIACVQSQSILYDKTHEYCYNNELKDKAWEEVTDTVNKIFHTKYSGE